MITSPQNPAKPEEKTVQIKVRPNRIVEGHSPGTVYFTTPSRARLLVEQHAVDIIGKPPEPQGDPGPSETKPVGASEKKSSDAPISGPTIGSASSNEPGSERPPSSLAADQASQSSSASESESRENAGTAGSSPSTTPTSDAPGQTSSTSPTSGGGNGTEKTPSSGRSRGTSARSNTRGGK
jgi:hypothetical protein